MRGLKVTKKIILICFKGERKMKMLSIREFEKLHPEKITKIIFTLGNDEPIEISYCSIDENDFISKRQQAIDFIHNEKKQTIKSELLKQKYLFN
jgi:hypothetical protein